MMNKTKHTPGPWHSRPVGFRGHMEVFTASDDLIAALHLRDDTAANARLIAAAPDLLDALQSMVDAYQTHFDVMPVAWQTFDNIARAALAKARGE